MKTLFAIFVSILLGSTQAAFPLFAASGSTAPAPGCSCSKCEVSCCPAPAGTTQPVSGLPISNSNHGQWQGIASSNAAFETAALSLGTTVPGHVPSSFFSPVPVYQRNCSYLI